MLACVSVVFVQACVSVVFVLACVSVVFVLACVSVHCSDHASNFLKWIVAHAVRKARVVPIGTIRVVPMGTIRVVPMGYGYNSSCTHKYNSSCTFVRVVPIGTIRVVPIGRDALASHAVSVYTGFSQAPSVAILAVGAEALSMTPSGDALFAS